MQSERIELPNGEKIKSLEGEKAYKYLGVLQFAINLRAVSFISLELE